MTEIQGRSGRLSVILVVLSIISVKFCQSSVAQALPDEGQRTPGPDSVATLWPFVDNEPIVWTTAVAGVGTSSTGEKTNVQVDESSAIRAAILFGSPGFAGIDRGGSRETSTAKSWLSFDKVQHVTFGFLFTLGSQYSLVNKLEISEKRALPVAISGSAAIGIGKELYDWRFRSRHHFSKGDLVADSIGILLAVGLILL